MVILDLPVPVTSEQLFLVLLGLSFGHAFSNFDYDMQQGKLYTGAPAWAQWLMKRLMDFTHHWWIGYAMYLYPLPLQFAEAIRWFGAGVFYDDLADYKQLLKRYKGLFGGTSEEAA